MLGAALRFAVGTATVAASGWVLRALQGSPAASVRGPMRSARSPRRSPHYRDGVFVNIEPAATINLDSEQRSLLVRELIGSRHARRPPDADPAGTRRQRSDHAADLAVDAGTGTPRR